MKKQETFTKLKNIRMTPTEAKLLEKLAKKAGKSQSRYMIERALAEEIKKLEAEVPEEWQPETGTAVIEEYTRRNYIENGDIILLKKNGDQFSVEKLR